VRLDTGEITGKPVDAGNGVTAFLGIPFAFPPVGNLRWKPPQPIKPWKGTRLCREYGPSCLQPPAAIVRDIPGRKSEDCLYLNVWTAGKTGDKRPVLVWIHGGGFSIGSGAQTTYDGQHFAARGAVLVTRT